MAWDTDGAAADRSAGTEHGIVGLAQDLVPFVQRQQWAISNATLALLLPVLGPSTTNPFCVQSISGRMLAALLSITLLLPVLGYCTGCLHMHACMRLSYSDVKTGDACLQRSCFKAGRLHKLLLRLPLRPAAAAPASKP